MWRIYSADNILFILHRVTGIALLIYLLAHIWTVSTAMLGGPGMFDSVMATLARPEFLIADMTLLGSVIFHSVNGLRLIAHERGWWLDSADGLARLTLVAWISLWGAAGAFAAVA